MGYLHINNLYKEKDILLFKRCYAMNKIHGTSAHVSWKEGQIHYFSGGEKHESFKKLFNEDELISKMKEHGVDFTVYGEAYGGKCQGMSKVYGPNLRFVAFDVQIGDNWLDVPRAEAFVRTLGLDFVDYVEVETDLELLNTIRDSDCPQAIRNGMGTGHKREGVVLRPLIELTKNNGQRVICKHKRDDYKETATPRAVSEEELAVLTEATAIADEWVTEMRVTHILDKVEGGATIDKMGTIIQMMFDDVKREGEGEIVWSKEAERAVKTKAAILVKRRLMKVKE